MSDVEVKRAYEPAAKSDGTRVLVDRIWPRGVSKEKLAVEHWLKAVAPTTELRKWFAHEAEKWSEFEQRYTEELADGEQAQALQQLRAYGGEGRLTLVYSARDEQHNQAVVLKKLLES